MVDQLRAVKAEIGDAQAIHDLIFGIENGGHPHTPAKRGASDGGGLVVDQLRAVKAEIGDAQAIHDLISVYAQRGDMLPRTMGEVYENLRDFFVVHEGGELVGCVALHIVWSDLAEVKSLAVSETVQARGLGSLLVNASVEEARNIGLERVFALTYRPAFFERLGFVQADVMTLPRKVWNECYRCPKFPSCNEIALVRELSAV